MVAGDRNRARVIALYGAIMAAGFAAGPIVLTVTRTESPAAVLFFAALNAAALGPILLVHRLAPVMSFAEPLRISGMVSAMPAILASYNFV